MKKFIALVALVLVSASTLMYAQESQRDIRRADRKAQRDAERARLKAEEQAADQVAYQRQTVCTGSRSGNLQTRPDSFRIVQH